jgi:hypothetical protein
MTSTPSPPPSLPPSPPPSPVRGVGCLIELEEHLLHAARDEEWRRVLSELRSQNSSWVRVPVPFTS